MSLKPAVNKSVHLFAAPFLWTAVGLMLMSRGYGWLPNAYRPYALGLAILVGTVKSLCILDKAARKSVQRIVTFQDGTCLGAVYSWTSWLLAGAMMAMGIGIRHIVTPGLWIGTLYCAIGWALCFSSRFGWKAWIEILGNNEIVK